MKNLVQKIKEDKEITILESKIAPVKKIKEMFSTFADLKLTFNSLNRLTSFCYDFMPSSIEIIDPHEFKADITELNNWLNDILAILHKYNAALINSIAENSQLKKRLEGK